MLVHQTVWKVWGVLLPTYSFIVYRIGFQCPRTDGRWLNTMETIWLQRPGGDVPWGFRLQGGREFAQPIAVQRVSETYLYNIVIFLCSHTS